MPRRRDPSTDHQGNYLAILPVPLGTVGTRLPFVIHIVIAASSPPPGVCERAATAMSTLMRRGTIAIVDDEAGLLVALSDSLQAYGFATTVYSSAEDWLERGAASPVDCLVLDIHLAGMSGIDLQRKLQDAGSALPIIFMTAHDDEGLRARAEQLGCIGYLRKPFSPRQLVEIIERASPREPSE
jgi:CheY-like chemotaxis protein